MSDYVSACHPIDDVHHFTTHHAFPHKLTVLQQWGNLSHYCTNPNSVIVCKCYTSASEAILIASGFYVRIVNTRIRVVGKYLASCWNLLDRNIHVFGVCVIISAAHRAETEWIVLVRMRIVSIKLQNKAVNLVMRVDVVGTAGSLGSSAECLLFFFLSFDRILPHTWRWGLQFLDSQAKGC